MASSFLFEHQDIVVCPECNGTFENADGGDNIQCSSCGRIFMLEDGIPYFYVPHQTDPSVKVTDTVRSFYEQVPFPNYELGDSIDTLRERAERGIYIPLLNDQIPDDAMVLEAGCGTGQLSNYLASRSSRSVFATDMTLNSLKLGHEFKERNDIGNLAFIQMNLFRPIFREESFDVVISNGVLHHTNDPYLGFQSISKLVKKNGYIIIGLYNKFGRVATNARRLMFRVLGTKFNLLDPRMRAGSLGDTRRHTWYKDQYENPHESTHSIGEVLQWFDRCGFEFVNGIPMTKPSQKFSKETQLFDASPPGNLAQRGLVQTRLMFSSIQSSGFFIMIGKRSA
jgi:SAM-dependent methyltransferase